MQFDNYTDLLRAMETELIRYDIRPIIKGAVRLAEHEIAQVIDFGNEEKVATGTIPAGTETLNLPADCIVPTFLLFDSNPVQWAEVASLDKLYQLREQNQPIAQAGNRRFTPSLVYKWGRKLYLSAAADDTDYVLHYHPGIVPLSEVENLVINPGFENGTLDGMVPTSGVVTGVQYWSISTTQARSGRYSLAYLAQDQTFQAVCVFNTSSLTDRQNQPAIYPGQKFRFEGWVKQTGSAPTATWNFQALWKTAAGAANGSWTSSPLTTAGDQWIPTLAVSAAAPANTAWAGLAINLNSGNPADTKLYFDDLFVARQDIVTGTQNRTNVLTQQCPNLLFYTALKHVAVYLEDDDKLNRYAQLAAAVVGPVAQREWRSRTSGGPLRMRPDFTPP